MQRIRIRYTKEDRVRFVSARDLVAVWERALRRTELPIAYSEGFHPHAKVSFPDALPVGYASTGEYAEMTFASPIEPGQGLADLSATLPPGMDIVTWVEVPDGASKLAKMLPATLWETVLKLESSSPTTTELLRDLAERARAADELIVIRRRPKGDRTIDIRPWLVDLHPYDRSDPDGRPTSVLRSMFRNEGPSVRPSDLLEALVALRPEIADQLAMPRLHRRVAQGVATDRGLTEALSGQLYWLAPDQLAETA